MARPIVAGAVTSTISDNGIPTAKASAVSPNRISVSMDVSRRFFGSAGRSVAVGVMA